MKPLKPRSILVTGGITALVVAVLWTLLVLFSLWTQREQLDRAAHALARLDAVTNLRKDMAIRKWASFVGGMYIREDHVVDLDALREQERVSAIRGNGETLKLVSLTPIHLLLAIQEVSQKEYGIRERLTSLQLRNLANAPDEWERKALQTLKAGGEMVAESMPKKGGHGLTRVMIPMRMEKECLECHRDTLVPVGGLRGAAAISVDLNAYRTAQEPTWRTIQYWHFGIWLLGLTTISFVWFVAGRRAIERVRGEQERRETETAFAAMAEGAIITDGSGSILWVNDAFCRIYGYEREEVIGRNPRILKSGRHDEAFYREFWRALTQTGHWRGELWNRRKTGEVFPEELSIQALRDAGGRITRFISIFSDITERKRSEEELRRHRQHLEDLVRQRTGELTVARDQAESANRSKSIFLANMSHELRTPLNAVIGFSQLMDRDADLSASQRRNLEIINRSGNHLLTIINDVLELSKIESGKTDLSLDGVDIGELLRQVVEMMRVRAGQAGLALRLEMWNLPPVVRLDAVKLRQVLLNLLSNAVKFTPAGEIVVGAAAEPAADGRVKISFSVRDTGIGIAPEDQQRIFRPFEQAGTRQDQGGTGLGLTISRQYVELMGGELLLESVSGQGATFRFAVIAGPGQRPAHPLVRGRIAGLRQADRGRRVLVADDAPEARLLVRSLLEPLGFAVREASAGRGALALSETFRPELVLLDWRMPELDGLETTRELRSRKSGSRIVMLTANVMDASREEALAAGVDEFMAKPYEEADFYAMLERQLGVIFERGVETPSLPVPACAPDIPRQWLERLAPDTLAGLRQAALSLSHERIGSALERVAAEDGALAARLRELADRMDYPSLWHLLGVAEAESQP